MGLFAAAAKTLKEGEPPMLDWDKQEMTTAGQNGTASKALAQGALATLSQTVVPVTPASTDLVRKGIDTAPLVGKMLNEALSSASTQTKIEEVKIIEQGLRAVPFEMYKEAAIVALKKGIPLERYEEFITQRIAPRYQLPKKHVEELCDSMFCELNQVSITEFAFQQEPPEGLPEGEAPNTFTFCRMVVYRREKAPGTQVLDLGYCFFNVSFKFGEEKIIKQIMEETTESIPRKFLFFTIGQDTKTKKTLKNVEAYRKFQMDWGAKEDIQAYFRFKAVQALSQDALQKGEDAELTFEHTGMSPIKDE